MRTKKMTLFIFAMMLLSYWATAQCIPNSIVSTIGGETQVEICLGSAMTSVTLRPGALAGPYAYAITDDQGIILEVTLGNKFDFDGAPAGVCRIYGVSWWGTPLRPIGEDITGAEFADFCSEISSNYIEVTRIQLGSGTMSDDQGGSTVYTCPGDGNADIVSFSYEGSSEANFTYLITDEVYNILGIPSSDSQDFEGAGEGVCLVWGLNYMGDLLAQVGGNALRDQLASGCFGLSENALTVVRAKPEAGTMNGPNGADDLHICAGDGVSDAYEFNAVDKSAAQFRLVVTNDKNEIVGLPPAGTVDFEGAGAGICRVWGASFTGEFLLSEGQLLDDAMIADGCFDLSSGYISVVRTFINGGTVSTSDGSNRVYTCTQDGAADLVSFQHEGQSEGDYVYIITSPTLEILGIEPADEHNFDNAPAGTCWVWGMAYTGNLTAQVGQNAGEIALSDACYDLSENYITVVRDIPNGGSVSMPSGATVRYTCTQDGTSDVVEFVASGVSNSRYAYIITSPTLEILGIEMNDFHDFDDAPPGICWVWGLAYTGDITAIVGDVVGQVALTSDCSDLSDNYITVNRDMPDGGIVSTFTGATTVYTCTQDGKGDFVSFSHKDQSNSKYVYIITSPTLEILGVEPADGHDFDDAPPGTCWVWGMAFTGNLLAKVGMNAGSDTLADDCYDLSDNFIEIIRDQPEGGTVSMPSGESEINTCTQDGNADVVEFSNAGASNSKYAYIITSPTLEILGIEMNDFHDFDDAPPGTCWVWGLAYTGNLVAKVGDNAGTVALSSDCYDLSDNYISVVRETPKGGMVSMPSGATTRYTCTQDSTADVVQFVADATAGSQYVYIITSPALEILGIEMNDFHDFDDAPPGVCWVWGLAYTGNLLAKVGDNAGEVMLSDGCFDLSDNYITVNRDIPDGGMVSMPSGATSRYTCTQDGIGDVVAFLASGTSNSKYAYIITSPTLEVLGIEMNDFHDFDDAPPGTCWVWGLAYTGNLVVEVGDNAGEVMLSDDCYDLSDNFIEVIRDEVEGGMVSMPSGATTRYTCTQDSIGDVVDFVAEGASHSKYAYIITSPTLEILGIEMNDFHDFDDAPPGTCWVWGLAYTGDLLAEVGNNAGEIMLSDDCYDLSDNFIAVIRDVPDGGKVATSTGAETVSVVVGDGTADVIEFAYSDASNSKYTYIVTDDQNSILAVPESNMVDFEDAPAGVCHVWGMAYTGMLLAKPGDAAATALLTDDCFDLSENFVVVTRTSNTLSKLANSTDGNQLNQGNLEARMISATRQDLTLEVSASKTKGRFDVLICDAWGRVIKSQKFDTGSANNRIEIPLNNVSSGLLLVTVMDGQQLITNKAMVH